MLLYYFPHYPGRYVMGFETSLATDFRYGQCAHVQFNTGRFLFRIIFKNYKSFNLFTSKI